VARDATGHRCLPREAGAGGCSPPLLCSQGHLLLWLPRWGVLRPSTGNVACCRLALPCQVGILLCVKSVEAFAVLVC